MPDYQYTRPTETWTLEQFIACQSDTEFNYQNLAFVNEIKYDWMNEIIKYPLYNVLADYLDELREQYCVRVTLSDNDLVKYIYRPKLLCYDIYGKEELFYVILLLNDICSSKKFTMKSLYMPTKDQMTELCKYIYNANRQAILRYASTDNDQN